MASRGDINLENVQPKLFDNWVKLSIEETIDKTGAFVKLKSKDYFEIGDFPVIDQGDKFISGYINDESLLYQGELPVIIFGDHTRNVKFIDFPFAAGADGTKILKPKSFYNPKFYHYYFKSLSVPDLGYSRHFSILKEIEFPLPPLAEQNRIVAKLDTLFAQLETIKTSMAKVPLLLKDFRQQVLTQAVTGKLTEEWRKGKEFKSPNVDFVNSTLLKENKELNKIQLIEGRSKIKLNPISYINKNEINWSVFTIESLCIVIVDCLHETATFSNDGYKLIDTNNIEPFKINKNKLRYVDASVYKKWVSRLKPEYGDIVYTREGTIGNALMIPENDKYCIGQRTMLFRFSKLMSEKFCELYMNSEAFKNQVKPHIKGVASQHVNIRDLRLLEMPVPSFEEQQEIVFRVESLLAKADAIEKQYETLKAKLESLPQAILHKAFKGELTEQLDSDGDARELLKEIEGLKAMSGKVSKKQKVKV